jgi:hypothetical protein
MVIDPKDGPGGLDACRSLLCLLEDDGVRRLLERNEIDAGRVARCVTLRCG